METVADLRVILTDENFTAESIAAIRQAGFGSADAVGRLSTVVGELEQRAAAGDGSAALKAGVCCLMLARLKEAIGWLEKAPAGALRSYYLGRAYMEARRFGEAAGQFDLAAKAGWGALECDCLKAECLILQREEAAAASLLERHAAEGSGSAQWHYVRGRLAELRNQLEEAIDCYDRALGVEASHPQAMFRLAFVLDLHGADERARDHYEDCAEQPYVYANALLNLAVLYEDDGQYELAARCLRRVLAVNPNHPRAMLYLKDVLAAREMYIDEYQLREHEKQAAVLDIPVTDFELSVRSRNCLKKMNINTLGDLLRTTEDQLLAYKNFGETSLREIRAMLAQKGLVLGQLAHQAADSPTAPVEAAGSPVSAAQAELLARPASTLELSVRARKCLQRLGVNTIGDLVARTESQLMESRNFGERSLQEVKDQLARLNLRLREG